MPASSAARLDLLEVLAQGGRTGGSRGSHRWHAALMIGEFALTCLLLVGANLMLRTLGNLYHADLGYTTERIQVNGDYFATLGIVLKAGRTFTPRDLEASPRVVIVDTLFAEKCFPGQNPIGKT